MTPNYVNNMFFQVFMYQEDISTANATNSFEGYNWLW